MGDRNRESEETGEFLKNSRARIERGFRQLERDYPEFMRGVRERLGCGEMAQGKAEQRSECGFARDEMKRKSGRGTDRNEAERRSGCGWSQNGERLLSEYERLAVMYLYTASPFSDLANNPFEMFVDFARHGVFLWREIEEVRALPEEFYLNYVLHHRVNEEEIRPCRALFWSELRERVAGKRAREAAIEVNYWCAEHVTYQSGDDRTLSALAVYRRGYGRCGEESVFLVNALRSVGIPARQVYAPRWSHCDDNHAWVELWCDGGWHFTGACEPLMILDQGWFTGAASRAMLVHSRVFPMYAGRTVDIKQKAVTEEAGSRESHGKSVEVDERENGEKSVGTEAREKTAKGDRVEAREKIGTTAGAAGGEDVRAETEMTTRAAGGDDMRAEIATTAGAASGEDMEKCVSEAGGVCVGREDAALVYNHLARYADTREVVIRVKDASGAGVCGAQVAFQVLNYAEYCTVARVVTEESGTATFLTGLGTLRVQVNWKANIRIFDLDVRKAQSREIRFGSETDSSMHIRKTEKDACKKGNTVRLPEDKLQETCLVQEFAVPGSAAPNEDGWNPVDVAAPAAAPYNRAMPDEEQKREGDRRLEQANAVRRREKEGWENPELRRFLEGGAAQRWGEALQHAEADGTVGGNDVPGGEIVAGAAGSGVRDAAALQVMRRQMSGCLSEKDRTDCSCAVLEEHLMCALAYRGQWSPELFVPYVLNPRISHEILRCYRRGILDYFSEEEKRAFREEPGRIWERIQRTVRAYPEHERETVMTTPYECLRSGTGSPQSQRILFVAIARTLGIPSRLNPEDGVPEYWNGARFAPAVANQERSAQLKLTDGDGTKWRYFQNWSLARLQDGTFRSLDLRARSWEASPAGVDWESERNPTGASREPERDLARASREPEWNLAGAGRESGWDLDGASCESGARSAEPDAGYVRGSVLHTLRVSLQPGIYRLITANRLPNGNCFTFEKTFELRAGEVRAECLRLREARLEDMLESVELPEFQVTDAAGAAVSSRELTSGGRRILMWLCPGQEPTEHILNELLEQEEAFRAYADRITLMLDRDEMPGKLAVHGNAHDPGENPTLQAVLRRLPGIDICRDSFAEHTELLSRSMYVDPTQLPLILVTDGAQNGIYAVSGYNVGTGALLLRILRERLLFTE